MTLQELITDLKAAGANDNTMQLAMNCYELGLDKAIEVERKASAEHHLVIMRGAIAGAVAAEREACAKLVDDIEARCIAKDVDDPPLAHVSAAIRARGNA